MKPDNDFMSMALDLARLGLGRTSPNPVVGAVIVKNGKVLATGFHRKAGMAHAEVEAIRSAVGARSSRPGGRTPPLHGATLYVNLEPCCPPKIGGRTPPCTDAILKAGIREVVIGMKDPDPRVSGRGVSFLKKHGLKVRTNILQKECEQLNEAYIKHRQTGMPWVILKAATTLDGRVATRTGESKWITGEEARLQAHHLRDRMDALLVGANTVRLDDPLLTTRLPGRNGHQPVRVVLSSSLDIDPGARVFQGLKKVPTWVATTRTVSHPRAKIFQKIGVRILTCQSQDDGIDLEDLLRQLGEESILNLMVEGGPMVHSAFLREGLADQMVIFMAPSFLGGFGLPLFSDLQVSRLTLMPRLYDISCRMVGEDLMVEGYFHKMGT